MYGIYLTLASIVLLAYILWRLSLLPRRRRVSRRAFLLAGLFLGLLLVVGRWLGHDAATPLAALPELVSMTMIGVLFLVFVCLFPVDLLTGFGRFFPRRAAVIRAWAVFAGCLLALLALFQGLRPPRVVRYDVFLPGLPRALDKSRLVAVSDLHLGASIGPGWLQARLAQVQALKPDMIAVLGDIFEGHGGSAAVFLPALHGLSAPLGVWAVDGNHETHGERDPALANPLRTLRDELVQPAPGLFLAGRRSLSRHGRQQGMQSWNPAPGTTPGALILLTHVPLEAEEAAKAGVGLMLSGHTHGGQIWPLDIVSRMVNPLLGGRYKIGGMTVIVCRGTGTWGPRMRLWRQGEILLITLHSQQ
jgi:predicted MPP superfamily phosphohydrolase